MNNIEKCGYYSDGECNICGMGISGEDTFCRLCKDNINCYYKQLDKLKAKKDKYYQQTLDDEIMLNELYQENERLKAEMTELEEKFLTLNDKSYSYYLTLQEIKKIAEEYHHNKPRLLCNMDKFIEQILQLITKVEEEDETKNT